MSASATRGTLKVDVSRMGVSISPSSFTCVEPTSLPKALLTKTAPGTFLRNRLPGCGRMAVTPVRTSLPRMTVVCPTSTPATSVIASSGPVGRTPTFSPKSEARGRASGVVFCAARAAVSSKSIMAGRSFLVIEEADYICDSRLSFDNCDNDAERCAHHVEREIFQAGHKGVVFFAENVDDEFLHFSANTSTARKPYI